jgi:2'-5' RNA ligase
MPRSRHDAHVVQSVELVLDEALDARVRTQWRALAAAGLPNLGRHTGTSNRPHLTLVVATGVGPEHEERLVTALGDATPDGGASVPLPVLLGGYVVFGTHRHVLARLVVPTAALLALQARTWAAWDGVLQRPDTVTPGRWTPHVTLAKHLTDTQVGQALTALRAGPGADADRPGRPDRTDQGHAVAVRRWDGERRVEWQVASAGP